MKFKAIYRRDVALFEKNTLKTSLIEKKITANSLSDAVKLAKKDEFKGFYLIGVKPLN